MVLETNKVQDIGKKTSKRRHFTKRGLLNSRYKRLVKHNFKKACKKSVFGIRQRFKSPKLSNEGRIATIVLKVSVFASAIVIALI